MKPLEQPCESGTTFKDRETEAHRLNDLLDVTGSNDSIPGLMPESAVNVH